MIERAANPVSQEMDTWRPVVKGMLTIVEEEEAAGGTDPNGDLDGMTNAEKKKAGQLTALRLFDCL